MSGGWAALGSIAGDAFGLWHSRAERQAQERFQQGEAASARAWSERMFDRSIDAAGRAHQREVADLKAAGLNPILSATGGSGSMSFGAPGTGIPSGSMGVTSTTLGSSAVDKMRMMEEVRLLREQQQTQREEQWRTRQDANLKSVQYNTELQRYEDMYWQAKRTQQEADIATQSAKGMRLEGEIDSTEYGAWMRYMDRAMRSITGGSSAYRNLGR